MGSAMFLPDRLCGGTMDFPAQRGRYDLQHMSALGRQTLSSDSIGSCALSLTNVVAGSAYDVEVLSTGSLVTSGVAAGGTVTVNVPVFAPGDAQNTVRIKIRKGTSAPFYQPYETQDTVAIGARSIFINQLTDE